MANSNSNPKAAGGRTSGMEGALLCLWLLVVLGVAGAAGYEACSRMGENLKDSNARHLARLDPKALESGISQEETEQEGADPVPVEVGVYVDRIPELSIKETRWSVDFYVWFRWQGDDVAPGEKFELVDGSIESKEKQADFHEGDRHYEMYRVIGSITKSFDVTRFPLDDHMLTLNIECPAYLRSELIFVPDGDLSKVSSRVRVPGYAIGDGRAVEKPHGYRSSRGDPRLPEDYHAIYSQFRFGIPLERDGWGVFLKLFQGLFASLAIALTAFFIKPTDVDPRFGLGVGAFFASIANTYITSSLIPDTAVMTLADTINGMGMALIFLTVVQSTISLYLYDICERESLSKAFDRVSIVGFGIGTLAVNIALPLTARGLIALE